MLPVRRNPNTCDTDGCALEEAEVVVKMGWGATVDIENMHMERPVVWLAFTMMDTMRETMVEGMPMAGSTMVAA